MNSWDHQRKLFRRVTTADNPATFLSEHKHEIDVDIFGKYCVDNDMTLFRYINILPVTYTNVSSWLSYAIQTNKQDVVKYLNDSFELIIDALVDSNSYNSRNRLRKILKLHPVTVIRSCIKHDKPIIFNNNEYHHFTIVMFALIDGKFDLVRQHLAYVTDKDYVSTIEYVINDMKATLDKDI